MAAANETKPTPNPDRRNTRLTIYGHSFASRALALDKCLTMFGKLLGHNDVQSTMRILRGIR